MFKRFYPFCLCLLSSVALAGGSIFGGGGGSHASNPDGVRSIGIHICGNLNCPDVIIRQGNCDGIENAFMQYGVCTCMDGYKVSGNQCVLKEDKCKGKKLNECQESCDGLTGKITNKPDDTPCVTDEDETLISSPSGFNVLLLIFADNIK